MKSSVLLATPDRTWQQRVPNAVADFCTVQVSATADTTARILSRKTFGIVVLDPRVWGGDSLAAVHALRHAPADRVLVATWAPWSHSVYLRESPNVDLVPIQHSMEALREILRAMLDPHAARTLREVRYQPKEDTFFVAFRNGKTYALSRKVIEADDGSAVVGQPRVVDDGDAFVVRLASGARYDVAADFVLYHHEPSYPYHKDRPDQQAREAHRGERIGRRVRDARARSGLTLEALAERTGMHASNVSRLESGKHTPSLETLERVAAALGVRVADLVAA